MTIADVKEAVREIATPRAAPPPIEYVPPRYPEPKACSPGNGNWREQLEHMYAHLIEHAQIDPDFRIALGEPKLGRVSTYDELGYFTNPPPFSPVTGNTVSLLGFSQSET